MTQDLVCLQVKSSKSSRIYTFFKNPEMGQIQDSNQLPFGSIFHILAYFLLFINQGVYFLPVEWHGALPLGEHPSDAVPHLRVVGLVEV